MNRKAIFAHFDVNNQIQEYVVYYLKELKKSCKSIIFVSDSNLSQKELKKIQQIVDHSIIGKHGEYDFGSYKRGFLYCINNNLLNDLHELVFCNDSCFGPIGKFGFKKLFEHLQNKPCNSYGIVINNYGLEKHENTYVYNKNKPHIQSYFIVLKSKIFNSKWFFDFINNITTENNKYDIIIKYEQGLSELITKNNCTIDSYLPLNSEKRDFVRNWKRTIEENGILIKKSQFKNVLIELNSINYYPTSLIKKFAKKELGNYKYFKIRLYNLKIQLIKFLKKILLFTII